MTAGALRTADAARAVRRHRHEDCFGSIETLSVAVEKTVEGRLLMLRIDDTDGVTTLVRPTERRP